MLAKVKTSVIVFAILSMAGAAWSADLYVVQKDPAASDKNSGTEAKPLKTIQAAVDKVQAGDTIWVKTGIYEEEILPRSSGRADAPITLSAWEDDRVCLGSILHDVPPAAAWKPVEKTQELGRATGRRPAQGRHGHHGRQAHRHRNQGHPAAWTPTSSGPPTVRQTERS